ncbi:MAG: glycosyltransferase [Candidatus Aenigmarchaeota archaeon]|nr:glycosyltransferase [Candidatus Aenigmarchaeota archaeon]
MNLHDLSLIVPLGPGRERHINILLDSIYKAKKSEKLREIVIVCDNSVLEKKISKRLKIVIYKSKKHINIPEARNVGIEMSSGKYLLFIDSDCIIPSNYLNFIETFEDGIYVGDFRVLSGANKWAKMQLTQDKNTFLRYVVGTNSVVLGCHFVMPRNLFNIVGKFDEDVAISDEREWGDKAIAKGYRITYVPNLFVYHQYSGSLKSIIRRRFWHGTGYHIFGSKKFHSSGKKDLKYWLKEYAASLKYAARLDFFGIYRIISVTFFMIGYYYGLFLRDWK